MNEWPESIPEHLRRKIEALVNTDVASVFELLRKAGVSQRRIARLTGQSQSEISEIRGGRKVRSIDVLAKIADGLSVSRRVFGLADTETSSAGPLTYLEPVATHGAAGNDNVPTPLHSVRVKEAEHELPHAVGPADVVTTLSRLHWTGLEVRLLRQAMRVTIGEAARKVGVSGPAWSLWERNGAAAVPKPAIQRRLDDHLTATADAEIRERFCAAVAGMTMPPPQMRLSPHLSPGNLFTWTGREAKALRMARRMSVRDFAAHMGISDRMVSKWEAGGTNARPRPVNQAALDTSLRLADSDAQERFYGALAYAFMPATGLTATPEADRNYRPDGEAQWWVIRVPVRVRGREAASVLTERIKTALCWLPDVEVGVEMDEGA